MRIRNLAKAGGALLIVIVLAACSSGMNGRASGFKSVAASESSSSSNQPRIKLTAYPSYGLAPMVVTLHAVLENVQPSDTTFKCLGQEWTFGDGAVSADESDCNSATMETDFLVEHVFEAPGTYTAIFRLGDNLVKSDPVTITVHSR